MKLRALLLLLSLAASGQVAAGPPQVTLLTTCSALSKGPYPADSMNWFDASRNSQVIFYAHLLFPAKPAAEELPDCPQQAWHPPLRSGLSPTAEGEGEARAIHRAEVEWNGPRGERVAFLGLSLPARSRSEWVRVAGRDYVPHTVAMAIGTADLRADAGQVKLPSQAGQYSVRLRVDGRSLGLAFFSMLRGDAAPSPTPSRSPAATPKASPEAGK